MNSFHSLYIARAIYTYTVITGRQGTGIHSGLDFQKLHENISCKKIIDIQLLNNEIFKPVCFSSTGNQRKKIA